MLTATMPKRLQKRLETAKDQLLRIQDSLNEIINDESNLADNEFDEIYYAAQDVFSAVEKINNLL